MMKLIKRILLMLSVLLTLAAVTLAYAYFIEPGRLVVTHTELRIPNFDPALDGLKVVAIADIHGGSNRITEEKLRQLVVTANAQNPDVIVLLGDYISEAKGKRGTLKMEVETIAKNLEGFDARLGVYGVIGNHDWWYNEKRVRAALESADIRVLENQTSVIDADGTPLTVWGIEDFWKHRKVPVEALPHDARNIIAITHNPDSLLHSPPNIAVMLAGHSHGGQINFPVYGAKAFVNDPRFMYGHAAVDSKHVFVTSGIGTSILPLRFRVPPEIAVVTLYSAN